MRKVSSPEKRASRASVAAILRQGHRKIHMLFDRFEQTDNELEKAKIVRHAIDELMNRARLKEALIYPACAAASPSSD